VAGSRSVTATACIVGCGPAGAMLGLLLARAGVEVVVLEKHAAAVQRRRWPPTVVTQGFQRLAQRFAIDRALRGNATPDAQSPMTPR
jgi:2-polyprenyl-6-methoxyphenol hydroxylase-like FAD-dependent oxidoreductase